jgi:CubicO group peptidase (beta-lactamase class C family)
VVRCALLLAVFEITACSGRDRDTALDELIAPAVEQLPGLQIVVEHRGEIVLDRGYGFADLEHQVPVTAETVFPIGSISKQFGAAAIMQLVETGRLSLDDKLATFFPEFPRGSRITIKDLLRHTSGIEDFEYTGPWPKTMAVERSDEEVVRLFRDRKPRFEPDHGWSYSTSNYLLLGMIVTKVTKQPFREYLREHVFARAGLAHTRYCDSYELIPHRARGYDGSPGAWVPAKMAHLTQFGVGGGLCSTSRDLLAWQKALESGQVVSAASYRAMTTALPLADGTPTGYGFGLCPSIMAGHRILWHSGGVSGFAAELSHFVDDDLRIAGITNARESLPWWPIVTKLLAIEPPVAQPIAVADLARYAKTFYSAPSEVKVVVDGDHLAASWVFEGKESPRVPFVHVGHHTFETADRLGRLAYKLDGDRVAQVELMFAGLTQYVRF